MLKKCVSSLLIIMMLAGCGNSAATASESPAAANISASTAEPSASAAAEEDHSADYEKAQNDAAQAVKDLGMNDLVEQIQDRVVSGLFFFDDGLVTGSSVYLSNNKKADMVGVFITGDPEKTEQYIKDYLNTLKDQMQSYNPTEVFKVDNAVMEDNGSEVVVIVADDLAAAKTEAESILGK